MLDIIDSLNSLGLPLNSILGSFDIMFPNIDNLGLSRGGANRGAEYFFTFTF